MVVVDNCCHVRSAIVKAFPDIKVVLDVWHFMMRYLACVINGTRNPLRSAVAQDLVDAILKSKADKHNLATYWSQAEQERRLSAAFEKWSSNGNVWAAAAAKTHAEQLAHVRKGCLSRPRQDVRSDGSRIEGTHKGWNSLQRAYASGLSVMTALCHDYVLRRNIRVVFRDNTPGPNPFVISTHGSHHIRLVDAVAKLWNLLLTKSKVKTPQGLHTLPELRIIPSGEVFGITNASYATSYHNLVEIKDEPDDELVDLSMQDEAAMQLILQDMNIDPQLLLQPLPASSVPRQNQHRSLTNVVAVTDSDPDSHSGQSSSIVEPVRMLGASSRGEWSITAGDVQQELAQTSLSKEVARSRGVVSSGAVSLTQQGHATLTPPPTPSSTASKRKASIDQSAVSGERSDFAEGSKKKQRMDAPASDIVHAKVCHVQYILNSFEPVLTSTGSSQVIKSKHFSTDTSITPPKAWCNASVLFHSTPESSAPKESTSLPNLPVLTVSGDTPSQRLFSIATGIHPRSMTISSNDEFYLFMDLRNERKWASFEMSPRKWVIAANEYNARLETFNRSRGTTTIRKTPRALMDKLGEIEPKILARIASGRYTCEYCFRAQSIHLPIEHCGAVQLIRSNGSETKKVHHQTELSRKTNTCTRCKTIMWLGLEGANINHRKGYFSDGVPQKPKKVEKVIGDKSESIFEELPPWPQPHGIFSGGNQFSPGAFLDAVQQMYMQLVVEKDTGGELSMEFCAFAALLEKRLTVTPDGLALFELYQSFKYPSTHTNLIIERNGNKYLRVDCLQDSDADSEPEIIDNL
ncbi:hypothetical protein B0H21DRAFT_697284 [Amylocystis lapponica]|nr:hypothetical protein B0H21DRAFT_697284 [Amylocystis lapponica]